MDIADNACGYQDLLVQEQIQNLDRTKQPRGSCLYCGEIVAGVFCNPKESDCRDEWEREQRLLQARGR